MHQKPKMLIPFARSSVNVNGIVIEDSGVERVDHCTLLGLQISNNLSWELHCQKMIKKANTWFCFLKLLERAKVPPADIFATYLAVVRLCAGVCLSGLEHDALAKLQERTLRIANTNISYHEALEKCNILSLKDSRTELCKRLFHHMHSESHILPEFNFLLSERTFIVLGMYSCSLFRNLKPTRFKNSFISCCHFNFQ